MTSNLISLSSLNDKYIKEKSTINSEPEWLMEIRNNAFSNYSSLPHEVSPLYKTYSPEEYLNQRIKELGKETSILKIGSSIVHSNISDNLSKQGVIISDLKN